MSLKTSHVEPYLYATRLSTQIASNKIPNTSYPQTFSLDADTFLGGGHSIVPKKTQAPTPQAPVRNRQTRKVANAKVRIG